ncbi:MAG: polysaccharide deacetylase family protein [Candidatus Rokubacteria bacterium]|nr:polysaccharide deacetylase family protein [Candidatus Rokubacteria bacterium]
MSGLVRLLRGGGRPPAPGLIVLMYHAIDDRRDHDQLALSRTLFRQQMGWLRELGYPVVPLQAGAAALGTGTLRSTVVALTFDDGYLSLYTEAFPILQEHGYPATAFLIGEVIERGGCATGMPERLGPAMEWRHAREMLRHGITFGSHSMTHRNLARLPLDQVRFEIGESKRMIEDRLSMAVTDFAYPYGSYGSFSEATTRIARECGFATVSTTVAGHNRRPGDVWRLRRLRISWTDGSRREIGKQCGGCYNWYALYQRLQGWWAGPRGRAGRLTAGKVIGAGRGR